MRVFTPNQIHHQDIDRAFQSSHSASPYTSSRPLPHANSIASFFSSDNFIIILLILLILLETKEDTPPKESSKIQE